MEALVGNVHTPKEFREIHSDANISQGRAVLFNSNNTLSYTTVLFLIHFNAMGHYQQQTGQKQGLSQCLRAPRHGAEDELHCILNDLCAQEV